MAHRTKEGTWRAQPRVNGCRVPGRTFPNRRLAEHWEAMVRTGQIEVDIGLAPDAEDESLPPPMPTFREFSERWMAEYCRIEKAETQWKEDQNRIDTYLVPAFGPKRLGELRRVDLESLKSRLAAGKGVSGRKLRPKTINLVLATAKKMLATAVGMELVRASPFAEVKLLKLGQQPFDYWTAEERDRFVALARQYDAAFAKLVLVACFTGMRRGELAGLQRYQLDFDRRVIHVSAMVNIKTRNRHQRTKNGKLGFVPMTAEVYDALKHLRFAPAQQAVFEMRLFRDPATRLRWLCAKTGQRAIRFHDLRHTFASCLVMEGVDLYSVQRLMRHENIGQTQRYAHLTPGYLRAAIDKLSRRDLKADTDLARESAKGGQGRLQAVEN